MPKARLHTNLTGGSDMYGKELILDLHNCDTSKFNRSDITIFFEELCELIDMKRGPFHFWDYEDNDQEDYDEAPDHLKGTTAIQFIFTSNITIHTLDVLRTVHLNVFSCKDFDPVKTELFCIDYFDGKVVNWEVINRI